MTVTIFPSSPVEMRSFRVGSFDDEEKEVCRTTTSKHRTQTDSATEGMKQIRLLPGDSKVNYACPSHRLLLGGSLSRPTKA